MNLRWIAKRERMRLAAAVCSLLLFLQPILFQLHEESHHACGHAHEEVEVACGIDLGHDHGHNDHQPHAIAPLVDTASCSVHSVAEPVVEESAGPGNGGITSGHGSHCVLCNPVARMGIQCDSRISLSVQMAPEAVSVLPQASEPLAAAVAPFSARAPPALS